jgi:hypothetical protein
MNESDTRPLVSWLILVYDRTAEERFPFKRKWYRFNYDRATDDEIADVLQLVDNRKEDSLPPMTREIGETRVSFSIGGAESTDSRILQYRQLFEFVPEEDLFSNIGTPSAFLSVTLPPDSYFEDENEQPITMLQVFDEEARLKNGDGAFAILMDHPESVVRCGPATPIRHDLWSETNAALVAQLIEVYGQLRRSRWLMSPCSVTPLSKSEYHAVLPVHEDCMAIILPFRQLYSRDGMDNLFNRCTKIHNQHCPNQHPYFAWVDHYKTAFNSFLDREVGFPLQNTGMPAWRYLDAFAYGARLVHATSRKADPVEDLTSLLASHPKPMVVMGYHYILRQLLGYVSMALPVLRQNVSHWISECGWAGDVMPGGRELFGA